jgi:hypothetical protein
MTAFGSAAQREFLEINCLLFCRAAKYFAICHQKQLNWLCFVLPRSECFWNLPTKATQINSILFCTAFCFAAQRKFWKSTKATQIFCSATQRKTSECANKNNSNWPYFGLPRFGICQQKQLKLTVFCSATREFLVLQLKFTAFFVGKSQNFRIAFAGKSRNFR